MKTLEKTVTINVKVDPRIADLVHFAMFLREKHGARALAMCDHDLIEEAESFWDTQHGED